MNDTPPQIETLLKKRWRTMPPARRFAIGCSMFDFAKELVRSGIRGARSESQHLTERQQLFLRFYGDQFSAVEKAKLLEHFR